MTTLAYIAFALSALLSFNQCIVVFFFVRILLRYRAPKLIENPQPRVAVVLCLRGPDPYLDNTLAGILKQDYTNYRIFIIVDSHIDPVWHDIKNAQSKFGKAAFNVKTLQNPLSSCSLKCSSLIQAVENLNPEYEIVAFMDGDAPPHRTWLTSMVETLSDPEIGVAYGNRWFMPKSSNWGSLVRYFWNIGAVVQVWLNQLVWAGSMAIRRNTIDDTDLLSAWSKALSVDATVHRQMRKHNYKIRFVPGVLIANREYISLTQFISWVQRQLIAAKSSGPSWRLVAVHAINLVGTQILSGLLLFYGFLFKKPLIMELAILAISVYWISNLVCATFLELSVRRNMHINQCKTRWLSMRKLLKLLPAMIITHIVYAYAITRAIFRNRFQWRGIQYLIEQKGTIKMVEYLPYESNSNDYSVESVI